MTSLKKGGRREHSSFNALEDTNTRYSIATTWVHMTYTYAENSEKVSHVVFCRRGVCRRVGGGNIPQSMHWEDSNTQYSIATTWVHMTYTYAEKSEKVSHVVLCRRGVCRRVGGGNIPQSMHWEDSNNQYSMLYSLAPQYEYI